MDNSISESVLSEETITNIFISEVKKRLQNIHQSNIVWQQPLWSTTIIISMAPYNSVYFGMERSWAIFVTIKTHGRNTKNTLTSWNNIFGLSCSNTINNSVLLCVKGTVTFEKVGMT